MACGAPVLANDAAALPEVAGEAALLVDATNSTALALALRHLLSNVSLQQWLARAGLRRAATFSWPGVAREVLTVYEEILA
jgi:alpha-1,3-rhamnosyl/mannosyltransferase